MPRRGYEYNPTYIVNLAQGMRNVPQHFLGQLADPYEAELESNPEQVVRNGEERLIFYWYPVDAKTAYNSDQLKETSIRKKHAKKFAEGELGPQTYYVWLPDNYESIPDSVDQFPDQLMSDAPALGQFFLEFFFKPIRTEQKLEALAEKDFEETRKIREAIQTTSLDDEIDDQVMRRLQQVIAMAEGEQPEDDQ